MKLQSHRHGEVLEQVNQQMLQSVPGQNQIPNKTGQQGEKSGLLFILHAVVGNNSQEAGLFLKEN